MKKFMVLFSVLMLVLCSSGMTNATVIRSPTSVINNTAGDYSASADIGQTIDQSGLSTTFTSGISDFDVYFGTPKHAMAYLNNEWWTPWYTTSGIVDYDFGDIYTFDRMALWNEDSHGIASVGVYTDTASDFSTALFHGTFNPTNNAYGIDYLADIFSLTTTAARYVRLDMVGSVGGSSGTDPAWLSMGEVAFSTSADPVPEPATMFLLGSGLIGLAGFRRKKK